MASIRDSTSRYFVPLTYPEITAEIADIGEMPRDDVERRVWMEALQIGWNVQRDLARFGVTPHVFDENMERLYTMSDGFIFETLVFWASPARQKWTVRALERIEQYCGGPRRAPQQLRLLMLGDGTGNDSLYLAAHGLQVDYFDVPGSKTFDFAVKRFQRRGVLGDAVRVLKDWDECRASQYDIVFCFEVLEHLRDPLTAISDIGTLLKPSGLALVTEAFGWLDEEFPTHLATNTRYAGRTPFLFLEHGLRLSWYSADPLFYPMEFTKSGRADLKDYASLWRDSHIRRRYLLHRWLNLGRRLQRVKL